MQILRNKLLAAAGAIAAAGAVTVAGLTAASAASTAPAVPAAAAVQPSVSGIEHFQIMSTSATSNKQSIIALGSVFTAGGVNLGGNRVDKAVFPGGTFKIRHFRGHGTTRFNPATCLLRINRHGTYKLRAGTGKYAGISGHGRYRLKIRAVTARNSNGHCSQSKPPVAFQQIIKAHGPVTLP
jgi:hypothetical protein